MPSEAQPTRAWLPAAVAGLRHDLLNNLTHIVGTAQTLEQEIRGKLESMESDLRTIRRLSSAAADMLADLNDLTASPDAPRVSKDVFPLGELIQELDDDFGTSARRKGLTFRANGRELKPTAVVGSDRRKLIRVLSNLLGNSVRYTSFGRIDLIGYWDGKGARIEVLDTGPGGAAEYADRRLPIAPPTEPATGPGPGGLGLWAARGLAELIGVKLTVEARPDGGSLFTLELPVPQDRDSSEFSLG